MVPSLPAEASRRPSGLKVTHPQTPVCPRRPITSRPVVGSQTRTVLSSPPEARRRPSRLKAAPRTSLLCLRVRRSAPVVVSHTSTRRLKLAVTRRSSFGPNASAVTGWRASRDSGKVHSGSPPTAASQTLTLPPHVPDARRRPSRLKATLIGRFSCPGKVCSGRSLLQSQAVTTPSHPAASRRPSGLNAAA